MARLTMVGLPTWTGFCGGGSAWSSHARQVPCQPCRNFSPSSIVPLGRQFHLNLENYSPFSPLFPHLL